MREMKDSGSEWIGQIANTHKLVRLKYIAEILDEYRKPVTAQYRNQNADILYDYYGASGIIDKIDGYTIDDHVMLIGEDGANLKLRNLPLMYEVCGKAWINNHAHILKPMKNVDFYYLFYALESLDINNYITGSAQPKLNQENLKEILIPLPSYGIQRKVASYLDTKCSEIDATAEDIQKEISLLEDYKKSVITEAVTKGLNPDAEMKDSGIEWVGKVPVTWKIMPNKYIMTKKKVIKEVYDDENIISLSMNGVIVRDLEAGGKMPKTFDGYQIVYPGNLLMCLFDYDVTPRCIGLIKDYGVTSPAYSQFVMNNYNYSGYYYYYYLMIDHAKTLLHLAKNLRHSFTEEQLGAILAPVPTVEEQYQIVNYLDTKCSEIDTLIADKKRQLDTLADYKKSLIYEYVTGKKEVPVNE